MVPRGHSNTQTFSPKQFDGHFGFVVRYEDPSVQILTWSGPTRLMAVGHGVMALGHGIGSVMGSWHWLMAFTLVK